MRCYLGVILVISFMIIGCDHFSVLLVNQQGFTIDKGGETIGCDVNINICEFNFSSISSAVTIKNNSKATIFIHKIDIRWFDDHNKAYMGSVSRFAEICLGQRFGYAAQLKELPIELNSNQEVTFSIDFSELTYSELCDDKSNTKHSAYIELQLKIDECFYNQSILL